MLALRALLFGVLATACTFEVVDDDGGDDMKIETALPRDGWWTGSTLWGRTYNGKNPLPGAVVAVANFDNIPGEPSPVTVNLTRNPRSNLAAQGNLDVRARVTFGVGGAAARTIDLDWANGVQFSIVAATLRVDAVGWQQFENNSVVPGVETISLTAMFGKGAAPGGLPTTYTTPIYQLKVNGAINGDNFQRIPIPPFARSVLPFFSQNLATAELFYGEEIDLFFEDRNYRRLGTVPIAHWTVGGGAGAGAVIPGSACFASMRNLNASTEAYLGLVFLLGL